MFDDPNLISVGGLAPVMAQIEVRAKLDELRERLAVGAPLKDAR